MILENKVALITGGAQGIGKAIAHELGRHGAAIALVDIQTESAQATAEELKQQDIACEPFVTDVVDADAVADLMKNVVDKMGSLDILVNNAGITRDNLLVRLKDEDWDQVMAINLKGAFNCTKAAARPMMKARSGRIINMASVVGLTGNAGQANYSASKGGIIGLTKSTAREFASRGINVNAVAPGYIETEMTGELTDEARTNFLQNIPLQRPGTPEDVANAVKFLAGPDAGYITGQVLQVDGGMVM